MLELPESDVIASQLRERLLGRRISHVVAAASPHRFAFYTCDPQRYPAMLEGLSLSDVHAYGGLVELEIEDMRFVFGDGATIHYLQPGVEPPAKHQLLFRLDDGSHLVWTIQMYGSLGVFKDGTNDNPYYLVAKEKPSPLTGAFTEPWFASLVSATPSKLSVKAFLATEQRIPGLGNGTLQDILFNARLNPRTKLATLDDAQLKQLYACTQDTLQVMAKQGGRDTEKNLFGESGGYRTLLSAKTFTKPCPRCGHEIIRQAYLGGNVYFCPMCQPV
ncbi:MAG: DNA-formamidopyrimidine glycosylase family protein [Sphaerochaetaceae bacterium]|nr:DNA-formamidopyrimidine glycosylase family protein [Sphaerochaetaceae bacterium]